MEDLIANEEVIITISEDDYIKRLPMDTFREQRRGGAGVSGAGMKKESDAVKALYVASTHDYLLVFTNRGRVHWIKVWQIPEGSRKSKGKALVNLLEGLEENEKIATTLRVASFDEEAFILHATKNGVVKKTALSAFSNPRKAGIYALSIDEGDDVIAARLVHEGDQIMLFTAGGMAVRFDQTNVREMGRTARGVIGVRLKGENDHVVGCEVVKGNESILVVCENGFGKRSWVEDFRQTNRGGSGVKSIITSERNGDVVSALAVGDQHGVVIMSQGGQTIRIRMADVRVMGRNTQGVRLANFSEGDSIVAVQKVECEEEVDVDALVEGAAVNVAAPSSTVASTSGSNVHPTVEVVDEEMAESDDLDDLEDEDLVDESSEDEV